MALPTTPSFGLEGRRALVTGGSRGIGRAAAAALAQAGAKVTIVGRDTAALAATTGEFHAAGLACEPLALDITAAREVDRVLSAAGPFQILVNNAGMNRPRLLVDTPDEDIDAVFELNVKAAFRVTRTVVRRLIAEGLGGSVINVSSQMGLVGSPRRSVYCATKHAMEGMTKSLAWELGPANIRVNTLCSTFIETPMTAPMFADESFRKWVIERIALGRLGRLDEVMGAVVFLASDASSLVTGSALVLDGGWTAV